VTDQIGAERLAEHLEDTYGFAARRHASLDQDVFRFDRDEGPSWVARVFPTNRAYADVLGDAAILQALAPSRFPAERCAHDEPVSLLDGHGVLVTDFVEGTRPERGGRIFAVLGTMLGALHARSGESFREGGGWHHLTPQGGPRQEIDGAIQLLEQRAPQLGGIDAAMVDRLIEELDGTVDCADLPLSFVHPDFVPANAISTPDGETVIVDWAGSGRGPRLWSLAFLLYATGGHPKLIELVVTRYRKRIELEPEELDTIADAIRARALLLDCWSVGHGRKKPGDAVRDLPGARAYGVTIAEATRAALEN
jgi:Ser/Thr protein kinase RdoA (MazF antagonist)